MIDCMIIGQGPAGISAALYLSRANYSVTVITNGLGALEKAKKIENYYGVFPPLTGGSLLDIGIQQARALGVELIQAEATGISGIGPFEVTTTAGTYSAKALLLATGKTRKKPNFRGLDAFEGHGVSYCAVCDGFFYRGKAVGVLGAGAYAAAEAGHLTALCRQVTVFTNGEASPAPMPEGVRVDTRPIEGLAGEEKLEKIAFSDGSQTGLDGLFIALGTASAADFANKLGIITKNGAILTDENQMTNMKGVFAAGDCTGGLAQIATAVGQGAIAGTAAIAYLRDS